MPRTKALALAAAMTLGLVTQAHSQFQVGIKGGLTFATLSESDLSPDFKSQTGFVAGIHFGIPLGKSLMFQPEALISQQGAGFTTGITTSSFKVSYLVVPANFRINLGSGGVQPFILGGPYAAFRLSCNVEDLLDCEALDLSSTDWGLDFGAGLKFGGFFAEARYSLGLTDISNLSEGFDSKQRVFTVMIGISF